MTSLSHHKFTGSLIPQKLTLRQVVDFWYNMDIYGANMDPIRNQHCDFSLLRYNFSITPRNFIKVTQFHTT